MPQSPLLLALAVALGLARTAAAEPLYGFYPFPYKEELGVVEEVFALAAEYGNLTSFVRDGKCIPWNELLTNGGVPSWLLLEWANDAVQIPQSEKVFAWTTPTAQDRHSLAPPCGPAGEEGGSYPPQWASLDLDNGQMFDRSDVQQAYLDYLRGWVRSFDADYVVTGIEMTQLLYNDAVGSGWAKYSGLATFVHDHLKAEFCDPAQPGCSCNPAVDPCGLQVGIELVLQDLLEPSPLVPATADTVRPLAEYGDFVGFSFYPFGSPFSECFLNPALPPPPEQWRLPLDAMRAFTQKPIAIAQTSYTTQNVTIDFGVECGEKTFTGSEALQQQYLQELAQRARDDNYVFVSWFVPVDYDLLPNQFGLNTLWTHSGLVRSDGTKKPAWNTWLAEFVPEPAPALQAGAALAVLIGIGAARRRSTN